MCETCRSKSKEKTTKNKSHLEGKIERVLFERGSEMGQGEKHNSTEFLVDN